jgi:acyltransferase
VNALTNKNRIYWIDAAKSIGIFLVFYGHVLEKLYRLDQPGIFSQYKFIYAFHMPFFFFISGFFFRRTNKSIWQILGNLFRKRILPVWTFGILAVPLWFIHMKLVDGNIDFNTTAQKAYRYLRGQPELNSVTWFLVCLFTVELIAHLTVRRTRKRFFILVIAGIFFRFGLELTENIAETVTSLGLYKNTWYLHEATVAFGFYALGYALLDPIKKIINMKIIWRLGLLLLSLGITILTYDLNKNFDGFVVVMKNSWHGESLYFLITALSGILFMIMLASLIPQLKLIEYFGSNTLILIGINGVFHTFVNPHLAKLINDQSSVEITVFSLLVTVASFTISVPIIMFFNRYVPQLIGKPHQQGPWLPKLGPIQIPLFTNFVNWMVNAFGSVAGNSQNPRNVDGSRQ